MARKQRRPARVPAAAPKVRPRARPVMTPVGIPVSSSSDAVDDLAITYDYVSHDLRRIAVLATLLLAAIIGSSYVL